MIKKHSDDPDVALAAQDALGVLQHTLKQLKTAETFDYGGHILKLGEYDVCETCTRPIAEAQQARDALLQRAKDIGDPNVRDHLQLAAHLFDLEAQAAVVRAEFHNGLGTEKILNTVLGFQYDHAIHDSYDHSHQGGAQ